MAKSVASEAMFSKQRNEKLNREILDKEQTVLDLQNQVTLKEASNQELKDALELSQAKVRALESFSSDLQHRYDRLEQRCKSKEANLDELLGSDLPAKCTEQKAQIISLQEMLMQREVEREAQLGSDGNNAYGKQVLEKQSAELVNLRQKVQEYEAREMRCEKKWTELTKENEFNAQQVAAYRSQVEKQRETYNKLLAVTE